MRRIEEFVDERHKSWCVHCTRSLTGLHTSEDHVPSKSLLRKPRPHNLLTVTICKQCNSSFSLDEQYLVAFLSSVLAGSTAPEKQGNASAGRALAGSPALRSTIERSRTEYVTHGGQTRMIWKPDMRRIQNVVLKNARGHAYFEFGEPMLAAPSHIWLCPLENMTEIQRQTFEEVNSEEDFAPCPEVGSRMMTRLFTSDDMVGHWVVVQGGTYRYSVQQNGGVQVRTVLSEYLATEVRWEE